MRNGNYISAAYYGDGRISTVTDTLGRVLTFNYDQYQNLLSITQPWQRETEGNPSPSQDETHSWATFGYANVTLQPSFSNLAIIGEQPGTVIPALTQVGLADGSYYKFAYNQWGQVWKVTRYAADSVAPTGQPNDSHPLSSTRLDLPGSDLQGASAQSDCPRFTQEREWVEYGVMNQSAEVTTSYDAWSPNMASCEVTVPDGTKQISYYGGAYPWQKGLVTSSETRSGGQTVRTSAVVWEHDGASNAAYFINPRVTRTTVSDPQGNALTTRVTYTTPADFQVNNGYTGSLNLRLPRKTEECIDANCSTVLRTSVTDYSVPSLDQYVGRRIIGLARNRYLYEGAESAGSLRSRVEYLYDQANTLQDTFLAALPAAAAQHDGTNYGQSMTWRGNANLMRRYSVDQTSGAVGSYVETRASFNVTGTVNYSKDAAGHRTSVDYADAFFMSVRRTQPSTLQTYAYPTTVTDPDNFTTTNSYNYDMGLIRETQSPLPNVTNNQPGPLSRVYYDAAGRLAKTLSVDTGAYTRLVFPAKMDAVQTYTLIEAGVESFSADILDGRGRIRAGLRSMPGSTGGYAGQLFDLDAMGRPARRSNPTETNAAGPTWAAVGDDAAGGWVYTQTSYDWKGRPLVVTNTDGTTREWTYGGCGCAGGEVVTERGELVPVPGTTNVARRVQQTYSDALGRPWKTEVLDWSGNVYAATTTKYDALDRAVRVRQYAGAALAPEPAGEAAGYQTTTMAYDGHGRLQSRHDPQQNAGASTTFAYNADDTPLTVTDARGAVTTFSYAGSNRRLATGVTHTISGGTTLNVTFEYDAAGNRKRMDYNRPEAGGANDYFTYEYDVQSRLTKETRHFAGLADPDHDLNYTYTLSGQLKTVTDPFGAQFTYGYDAAGRVTSVTGSAYAGVTNYATGVQYRAWGRVKAAAFGDGSSETTAYDGRMRPSQYRLTGPTASWQRLDYTFNADDRLRLVTDLDDTQGTLPPSTLRFFSLRYGYDHAGRVVNAGGAGGQIPYMQTYAYDAFGNMTSRSGAYWYQQSLSDSGTYVNNRRQGWTYDADGRLTISPANTSSNRRDWAYDAAGRLASTTETSGTTTDTLTTSYDGDGRTVREAKTGGSAPGTHYLVRSTVLGGEVVTRLTGAGAKEDTYVPAGGLIQARQTVQSSNGQPAVVWTHLDPTGTSEPGASYDPLGNRIVPQNPPQPQSPPMPASGMYGPGWGGAGSSFSNANNYATGCRMDGAPATCSSVMSAINGEQYQRLVITTPQGWNAISDVFGGYVPLPTYRVGVVHYWKYQPVDSNRVRWIPRYGRIWTIDIRASFNAGTGGAGGGGGGTPPAQNKAVFDERKFKECLEKLKVKFDKDANYFRDGEMEFFGYSDDAKSVWDFSDKDGHFKVTTDHDKYSTGELKAMVCPLGCAYEVVGVTRKDSKLDSDYNFTNYIGSDVVGMPSRFSDIFVMATWIHELGNALEKITGNKLDLPADYKERYGHDDAGVAFEECVFGGKVLPHGGLDRPK